MNLIHAEGVPPSSGIKVGLWFVHVCAVLWKGNQSIRLSRTELYDVRLLDMQNLAESCRLASFKLSVNWLKNVRGTRILLAWRMCVCVRVHSCCCAIAAQVQRLDGNGASLCRNRFRQLCATISSWTCTVRCITCTQNLVKHRKQCKTLFGNMF